MRRSGTQAPPSTGRMGDEERSQDGNKGKAAEPATEADQEVRGDGVDDFRDSCASPPPLLDEWEMKNGAKTAIRGY
jgi:hypothetical protein